MRSRFLFSLCGCLVLGLTRLADAEITESKQDLLLSVRSGFLSWAREHRGTSGTLGKMDRLLLIQAGAAFADVMVIGPVNSDMPLDARILEAELGGKTDVEYGEEEELSVVLAELQSNAVFKRSSLTTVPLGRLATALRRKGYRVFAVARARKYVAVTGLRQVDETRRWRYYEPGSETEATFRATLTGTELWGPGIMMFGPLVFLLIGFGLATLYGRQASIEVEKRRSVYKKLVLWPVFGSIAVCLPFAFWLILDGHLYPLGDLWFGSASASTFMMLILPTLIVPLTLLGPISRVEARLFGPSPDEPLEEIKRESKEVGKSPRLFGIVLIIALFAAWALCPLFLPRELRWINEALFILLMASILFRSALIEKFAKFQGRSVLDTDPNDPLLREVDLLARQARRQILKVTVVEPNAPETAPTCFFFRGELTVNKPFLALPEAERRFGLALALTQSFGGGLAKPLVLAVPIMGGVLLLSQNGPPRLRELGPILLVVPVVLLIPYVLWSTRKAIYVSTRQSMVRALLIGRDVGAARNYLKKVQGTSTQLMEDQSPRAKRLRAEMNDAFESAINEYEERAT